MPDVFKILKDLELKCVGLDESTKKMQEGYFVAFRSVGLPIHKQDFANPYSPLGAGASADVPATDPIDPKDAPKTASGEIDEDKIALLGIAKAQQAYLNTFLLTDDKLRMNHDYSVMPGSSKVSDSWYAIITGANGVPAKSDLSPAMKAEYDKARAKLADAAGNLTPRYEAYMKWQDEYRSKVRSWQRAYASAFTNPQRLQQWPIEGTLYHQEADEAMDRWSGFGFKEEVETALATLAAQGMDPAIALIARAKKRFQNSLLEFQSVGQIPYTMMLPRTWYDVDNDDGWNEYTSRDFHHESHYQASSTSYGGGGGFNIGFWSASSSFNRSEQRTSMEIQTNDLEIGFKYCAVDIKRPWLDTSLLNLRNWFLVGDYKRGCISTGKMAQELPQEAIEPTFLPSLVTTLVLIKDLSIRWSNWKSDWDSHSTSTSASASVGFGPFAVRGSYSHHNEKRDFVADASGEALRIPGIQLIGYVSTINPLSPGLDSAPFVNP